MTVRIVQAGLALSVQGPSREGLARIGVPGAGPMDPVAVAALHALLGNPAETPILEFAGGTLRVQVAVPMALAALGDGYALDVDGVLVDPGRVVTCAGGATVTMRARRPRGWAYLAFAGQWAIPAVMGSPGTDVRNQIGGFAGRLLQAGDDIGIFPSGLPVAAPALRLRWPVDTDPDAPWPLVVHEPELAGPLLDGPCKILPDSNRQALVLAADQAIPHAERQRVSRPQWTGAIQALPDGRFALLGPEAQTVGGYPLVASLAAADLPRLGRCSAGQSLRFVAVDPAMAAERACAAASALADWLARIRSRGHAPA